MSEAVSIYASEQSWGCSWRWIPQDTHPRLLHESGECRLFVRRGDGKSKAGSQWQRRRGWEAIGVRNQYFRYLIYIIQIKSILQEGLLAWLPKSMALAVRHQCLNKSTLKSYSSFSVDQQRTASSAAEMKDEQVAAYACLMEEPNRSEIDGAWRVLHNGLLSIEEWYNLEQNTMMEMNCANVHVSAPPSSASLWGCLWLAPIVLLGLF